MTEQDQVIIGCIPRTMPAKVPSQEVRCRECGDELWCSNRILEEQPGAWTFCIPCLSHTMREQGISEARLLESQRDDLRASGMNDRQIDQAVELGNVILQGLIEIGDPNFGQNP